MKTPLINSILRERYIMLFKSLNNGGKRLNLRALAKKINMTYPYFIKIFEQMENNGIVKREHFAREHKASITPKGNKLLNHFMEIEKLLK